METDSFIDPECMPGGYEVAVSSSARSKSNIRHLLGFGDRHANALFGPGGKTWIRRPTCGTSARHDDRQIRITNMDTNI
jgi:hypothetical protein